MYKNNLARSTSTRLIIPHINWSWWYLIVGVCPAVAGVE